MTTCTRYDDAALIALLDGGPAGHDEEALEHHLTTCPACAERQARVRSRSARLSHLLRVDASPGDAPVGQPGMEAALDTADGAQRRDAGRPRTPLTRGRVAAAVVVLAAFGMSPAAATVRDWVTGLGSEAPIPSLPEPRPATTSYTFDVVGGALEIHVASDDAAAVLVLRHAEVDGGSVTVAGGSGDEEITLSPGRVVLATRRPSPATVEVVVPTGTALRVDVGGVPLEWPSRDGGDADGTWTIELGGAGPTPPGQP